MERKLNLYQKIVARWNNYFLAGAIGLIVGGVMCGMYVSLTNMYNTHRLTEATDTFDGYVEAAIEVDWDEYDDPTLIAYEYYFMHPVLGPIRNTSFAKHKAIVYKPGQKVKIVYLPDAPYVNKMKGLRYDPNLGNARFAIIILIAGFVVSAYGLWISRKAVPLLLNGTFVWGNFLKNRKVLTKNDEKDAYELYYEYQASDKLFHTTSTITTDPKDFENDEIVICNPDDPKDDRLLYDYPYYLAKFIEKNWEDVKKIC